MTKEVIIKIKGLQFAEDTDEEEMEVLTAGIYYEKEGRNYVKYDEVMEGFTGEINNLLKFTDNSVEVTKKGITNVHMVFEEGKKNMTYYDTPFGNFLLGISATDIRILKEEEEIRIHIEYALEINNQYMADCTIDIVIQSKDKKETRLLS